MHFLMELPVWLVFILIFLFRIIDVSIGTVRTIAVVQGFLKISIFLAFAEVLIWIIAISQVISMFDDYPVLMLAYALGFSGGNAVGIWIERKLALGGVVVRIITEKTKGDELAKELRAKGYYLTSFDGQGMEGPRVLLFIMCARKVLPNLLKFAKQKDPKIFYAVEPLKECSVDFMPHITGWRGGWRFSIKKK